MAELSHQEDFEDKLFGNTESTPEPKPVEKNWSESEIDPTDLGLSREMKPGEEEHNLSDFFKAVRKGKYPIRNKAIKKKK